MGTSGDVAERLVGAIKAKDFDAVLGVMHPDVVMHEAESLPYGGDWVGHDGVVKLLEVMMGTFDITIHDSQIFDPGLDQVAAKVDATFVARATGDSLRTQVVEIYTIRDGQIIDADIFPKDTAAITALAKAAGM